MIDDQDAVMIEEALHHLNIGSKGLILILNSPGGIGLAAERIINICRSYSHQKFEVLIPNMAKSAATMICFGSNLIHLSKTSELGPIDPQIAIKEGDNIKRLSVHSIITSYEKLFNDAINANGRIEPYLQQLSQYDARDIEELRRETELSESIAVKYLKMGMMNTLTEEEIKEKIKPFLSPLESKSHGRPIFIEQAKECGLKVNEINMKGDLWHNIWELFLRCNYVLSRDIFKLIETCKDSYAAN